MKSFAFKTYIKAVLNILLFVISTIVFIFLLPKSICFILVLTIGGILAVISSPIAKLIESKLKIKYEISSGIAIGSVILAAVLFVWLICSSIIKEGTSLLIQIPILLENTINVLSNTDESFSFLKEYLPSDVQLINTEIVGALKSVVDVVVNEFKSPAIAFVGDFALSLPSAIIVTVMCLLFAYYCTAEMDNISQKAAFFLPDPLKRKLLILKKVFVDAIGGYFKAQFKIEAWIFLLLLVGFAIIGVKSPILIAFLTAFADILPILGTGTILIPWSIVELINKDYFTAVGVLIIWLAALVIRQIIQPKIVSESVDLPPIPTIILMLAGYCYAGFTGLIFSVPIGIIFINLYKEGMFDNTIKSIRVLYIGFEHFRYYTKEEEADIK